MTATNNIFESLKIFNTITFIYGLTDKNLINIQTKYKNFLIIFLLHLICYALLLIKYMKLYYEKTFQAIFYGLEAFNYHLTIFIVMIYYVRNSDRLYKILTEINKIDRKFEKNILNKNLLHKLNDFWISCVGSTTFIVIALIKIVEYCWERYSVFDVGVKFSYCVSIVTTFLLIKIQMYVYLIAFRNRAKLLQEGTV